MTRPLVEIKKKIYEENYVNGYCCLVYGGLPK